MPSNHLILCCPLLLLPLFFPSIRVFPNEQALRIRWPKYWTSASASVLPVNIQGWSFSYTLLFLKICLCGPFLRSFSNLLPYCFCFMFWFFGHKARGILAHRLGSKLHPLQWKSPPLDQQGSSILHFYFFPSCPSVIFMFFLVVSTFLNNPVLFRSKYSGKKIKETERRKRKEQVKKKKERKEDWEEEIQPDTYLVSFFSCEPGVFQSMT